MLIIEQNGCHFGILINQHHFFNLRELPRLQLIKIYSAWKIRCIKATGISPCILKSVLQYFDRNLYKTIVSQIIYIQISDSLQ
ncbi:MAG: hypothetical protein P4L35_16895, partial [Ignavibacteriaceae bacterium]|nr:hypothetical protein [Ignavibacteriaceae bacterium]